MHRQTRDNLAGIARLALPIVACTTLCMLLAANWTNPNDPAAGEILGILGPLLGGLIGVIWASLYDDRRWRERQAREQHRSESSAAHTETERREAL